MCFKTPSSTSGSFSADNDTGSDGSFDGLFIIHVAARFERGEEGLNEV